MATSAKSQVQNHKQFIIYHFTSYRIKAPNSHFITNNMYIQSDIFDYAHKYGDTLLVCGLKVETAQI